MAAKGKKPKPKSKPKKTGSPSTSRSTTDRRLQSMVMAAVEQLDEEMSQAVLLALMQEHPQLVREIHSLIGEALTMRDADTVAEDLVMELTGIDPENDLWVMWSRERPSVRSLRRS